MVWYVFLNSAEFFLDSKYASKFFHLSDKAKKFYIFGPWYRLPTKTGALLDFIKNRLLPKTRDCLKRLFELLLDLFEESWLELLCSVTTKLSLMESSQTGGVFWSPDDFQNLNRRKNFLIASIFDFLSWIELLNLYQKFATDTSGHAVWKIKNKQIVLKIEQCCQPFMKWKCQLRKWQNDAGYSSFET